AGHWPGSRILDKPLFPTGLCRYGFTDYFLPAVVKYPGGSGDVDCRGTGHRSASSVADSTHRFIGTAMVFHCTTDSVHAAGLDVRAGLDHTVQKPGCWRWYRLAGIPGVYSTKLVGLWHVANYGDLHAAFYPVRDPAGHRRDEKPAR